MLISDVKHYSQIKLSLCIVLPEERYVDPVNFDLTSFYDDLYFAQQNLLHHISFLCVQS